MHIDFRIHCYSVYISIAMACMLHSVKTQGGYFNVPFMVISVAIYMLSRSQCILKSLPRKLGDYFDIQGSEFWHY